MPCRVENIVRKGEIACYKQFLFFSLCFLQLYMSLMCQNEALCGNGLKKKTFAKHQRENKKCC